MRRWIIELLAGVPRSGHIRLGPIDRGHHCGALGPVLRHPGDGRPDRAGFILAKGHAALALYAAMHYQGLLDEAVFHSYCTDGSLLGAHPEHGLAGVESVVRLAGAGPLGGCWAGATRYGGGGSPARVVVLLSDAECNEGRSGRRRPSRRTTGSAT